MKLNLSFEIDLEEVLRMLGAQGTKMCIRDRYMNVPAPRRSAATFTAAPMERGMGR